MIRSKIRLRKKALDLKLKTRGKGALWDRVVSLKSFVDELSNFTIVIILLVCVSLFLLVAESMWTYNVNLDQLGKRMRMVIDMSALQCIVLMWFWIFDGARPPIPQDYGGSKNK